MSSDKLNFINEILAIDDETVEVFGNWINIVGNIFNSNAHNANSFIDEFFFVFSNFFDVMLILFQ